MVAERPPYRPFRFIFGVFASVLVALVVWFPLALLTAGLFTGPAEEVEFDSLNQARESAFAGVAGVAWPGSRVEVHETDGGHEVSRVWLAWTEVSLPLDGQLRSNTARYTYGAGNSIQLAIIVVVAAIPAVLLWWGLGKRS